MLDIVKPQDAEILIKVDHDDDDTRAFLDEKNHPQVRQISMENKGFMGMTGYLNCLAQEAQGEYFLFASDDIYITTPHWDKKMEGIVGMASYKYYDGAWHEDRNPLYIDRLWYDTLGFIAPDDCPFADGFMAVAGRQLGLLHDTDITCWRDVTDFKDEERQALVRSIPMYTVPQDVYHILGVLVA